MVEVIAYSAGFSLVALLMVLLTVSHLIEKYLDRDSREAKMIQVLRDSIIYNKAKTPQEAAKIIEDMKDRAKIRDTITEVTENTHSTSTNSAVGFSTVGGDKYYFASEVPSEFISRIPEERLLKKEEKQ